MESYYGNGKRADGIGTAQTRKMHADITFDDYVSIFLAEKRLLLSPVTVQNYARELKRAIRYFGRESMTGISFLRMKRYFCELPERERSRRTGRPLAPGTVRQHYIVLHSFFENAAENEVIYENPMKRIKHLTESKNAVIEEPLSYDETQVRYIIRCLAEEPCMWRAAVMFALDSGCRSGEVMGLKWSDISLATGKVVICRTVRYTAGLGTFMSSPKSGKNRIIYLNKPALACLCEWKAAQESEILYRDAAQKEAGYCFTQRDGSPLIPVAFNNYLSRFGRKYGLPGIHPHALRHTMASLSIANGADIVSVSNKLGHSNISITLDIYSHANLHAQLRANAALADAIY